MEKDKLNAKLKKSIINGNSATTNSNSKSIVMQEKQKVIFIIFKMNKIIY
jgi:hypothetical protein